ncbi:MAG: glutamate formimidoyltransferase [Candidatus Vecturithrix sp.]|jgi:glutamate formiminotransferase/formiminotetrahydrofolate cyclodeaminase|nr:glutamate formimidoyltransferase [Candidatus Vecturithrix sp.]
MKTWLVVAASAVDRRREETLQRLLRTWDLQKMMRKLVECVPNFSEGRRPEIIEAIVSQIKAIPDVFLLDQEMDADHNRTVVTIVGEPEAAKEALFRMIKKAADLIDLNQHRGEHPRMGATDVVPFIPLEHMSTEECVRLARDLGKRVGDELQIPVFLYEDAATRPDRKNLASVRKGQFEGLREEIGTNPDRDPDYGPDRIHPTAGAIAIGARFFLVAYNVNLDSQDIDLAKRIAKDIRESSGGFPCVKALGFELADRHIVQISMNLVNYTVTSLATVYQAIQEKAAAAGVEILESEIVGLVPQEALVDAAVEMLQIRNFSPEQIIEHKVAQVVGEQSVDLAFLEDLASGSPAPGGGSASALAGALAAALASMVCQLTQGKKKFAEVTQEIEAIHAKMRQVQSRLQQLVTEDTIAFNAVMDAYKLPKTTPKEQTARQEAIQHAAKRAAETPLEVMQQALEVIKSAEILAEKGNPNAITDAGCAVHLAKAAIEGAALNVKINLNSIADAAFTQRLAQEVQHIRETADRLICKILEKVSAKI